MEKGVSRRFELYLSGVEVANGYDELQDAPAYEKIFNRENDKRRCLNKSFLTADTSFLQQLKRPLPQCSGVAIGIDRLISQIA